MRTGGDHPATRVGRLVAGVAVLALLTSGGVALAQTSGAGATAATSSRASTQPKPSIFGIDTTTYDSKKGDFFKDLPVAHRLGARWIRWTLGPTSAHGNYQAAGYLVKQARKRGMGIVLSLAGITSACSERPMPSDVRICPPTTRSDLQHYEAYVRRVIVHFRRQVSYYESWREPNRTTSWYPRPNPRAYAALLEADYATFQSVNRSYHLHLKLLFGSPSVFDLMPHKHGGIAVLPFTHRVLHDLHGRKPFNAIALHAYRFPPDKGPSALESDYVGGIPVRRKAHGPFPAQGCNKTPWCSMTWPQELSAYEQEFKDHGYGQVPLWLTEFGWPGSRVAHGRYFPSAVTQAKFLREAYADLLRLPFVQAALWFNLRDYQPGLKTSDASYFYHYGLLYYDYKRKPAADAFEALAKAHPDR